MPDNDLFRRSFDAGVAFTQLTRKRAETLVRELVKNGEVSRDQASARVEELLERSRQNSEAIIAIVRKEIDDRIAALNLVTRDDLTNLASRLGMPGASGRAKPAPAARAAKTATTATTPAPKKVAPTKTSAAPRATSRPAKVAAVTKAPSVRGAAKKATKSVKKA